MKRSNDRQPGRQPLRRDTAAEGVRAILPDKRPSNPVRDRRIDPHWIGHYRALLALRARLTGDRRDELADVAIPLEAHSMSQADSASDEFDHDMMLAELTAVQDCLFEIDAALRRIESHTYGCCEITGKPIPAARLRAIPWTRFTEEAGMRLERQGAVKRAHLGELHSVRAPGLTTPGPTETILEQREPTADDLPKFARGIEAGEQQMEEQEAVERSKERLEDEP